MRPNNSQLVACGDVVVVAVLHNAAAVGDVAVVDDVMVVVGAMAIVVVWVQQC